MTKKTKSQEFAEHWVFSTLTNGPLPKAMKANKPQQKSLARLLRAGYADVHFHSNTATHEWQEVANLDRVSLDMADVLLAIANLIDVGLSSHDDVRDEFEDDRIKKMEKSRTYPQRQRSTSVQRRKE